MVDKIERFRGSPAIRSPSSRIESVSVPAPRSVARRFLRACRCKSRVVPDWPKRRKTRWTAADLAGCRSPSGWFGDSARICGQPRRPSVRNTEFRGLLIAIFDLPRCPARFFLLIGETDSSRWSGRSTSAFDDTPRWPSLIAQHGIFASCV